MKRLLLSLLLLLTISISSYSQENYTVEGQNYSLITEVGGQLTLLWNVIDGEYRYFSKKDNEILELKNTKTSDGYDEEFKQVLRGQTSGADMRLANTKLTLPSLRKFFNAYNSKVDPAFSYEDPSVVLKTRLGAFVGVSNNVYFVNPDNTTLPAAGIEFEIIDDVKLLRHAMVLRFTQLFSSSDYDFSSSDISLNYRFKFVKSESVDIYANARIVSYKNISRDLIVTNDNGQEEMVSASGGEFTVPAAFGIGADIPLGNGFIIVSYNDLFGLNLDSNGDFPIDLSVGYKWNL